MLHETRRSPVRLIASTFAAICALMFSALSPAHADIDAGTGTITGTISSSSLGTDLQDVAIGLYTYDEVSGEFRQEWPDGNSYAATTYEDFESKWRFNFYDVEPGRFKLGYSLNWGGTNRTLLFELGDEFELADGESKDVGNKSLTVAGSIAGHV